VLREALGAEIMVHFTIDAPPAQTEDVRELVRDLGDERAIQEVTQERQETTMVGRFSPETRIREGEVASVAVDTRRLHFFDPETGLAIYDEAGDGKSA
jgi:multiple sugar transport system ATP-binding protein